MDTINMILELTKNNLIKCGFEPETITKIMTWENYGNYQFISDKEYLVVQSEKKIYVEIEASRKNMQINKDCFPIRFTELFIEYYNIWLDAFLEVRKQQLGTLYNELNEIEDYKSEQRELFETKIQWQKEFIDKMKGREHINRKKTILLYRRYITEVLNKQPQPIEVNKLTLEDLFCDKNEIEKCFQVLRDLDKPVITADNKYIGNNKGIIPLWIKILQSQKPKALINTKLKDKEISIILNDSIEGLCLTKDASEFRKDYVSLEKNGTEIQIKALLASY